MDGFNFDGSPMLTKAINFQDFYIFGLYMYVSQPFHRYILVSHGFTENDAHTKHFAQSTRIGYQLH